MGKKFFGAYMKAIVSVIGRDRTGIIAKVSGKLFQMNVNIEDISQTVMQSAYFTMIMMITLPDGVGIADVNAALAPVAAELGVEIRAQHEDIFNSMHRI